MSEKAIILYDDEYVFILENDNGFISIVEGPVRLNLFPNQSLFGQKKKKTTLKENEWVAVRNPYNKATKLCAMGVREIRKGPLVFSLYPGEELENNITRSYILNANQALVLQALSDHGDKKAGQKFSIKGPANYIPNTVETVVSTIEAINVSQNEAIYVRNITTAQLKMVKGPISYLLPVDEELYNKSLTDEEATALGLSSNSSYRAPVINLLKDECLCIIDYKNNKESYAYGPKVVILGPHEGVKVLTLSGEVPKREGVAKAAKLHFGPDFMNDMFQIRTKDNALLQIHLTYKWRFIVHEDLIDNMFASDFIGYACQSMRSRIRETASSYDFEQFHNGSAQILRSKLFKEYKVTGKLDGVEAEEKVTGRYFRENLFLIFELDVKEVTPVDEEIAKLLNESIKSNMKILCRKLEDSAQLQSEKERIDSEAEIAKLRKNVIEIENSNFLKATLEKAKIEGEALVEKAKAEKDAEELIKRSKMETELSKMRSTMDLLKGPQGSKYLEYVRIASISKSVQQAFVVPSNTNLFLPSHSNSHNQNVNTAELAAITDSSSNYGE